MKLEFAGLSDVGKVRRKNEDDFGYLENEGVSLVCDGMGGHNGGAYASDVAVNTILDIYQQPINDLIEKIASDLDSSYRRKAIKAVCSIRLANRHIFETAAANMEFSGMGTTAALIGFENGYAVLAHVGDSRIYRLRDRVLQQLTEDHSWLNELIADKEIAKEDAHHFKKKNVITRALGMSDRIKIDLRIEPVLSEDIFLLCTDGLSNSLNDDLIQAIIVKNQDSMEKAAEHLIEMANKADGSDNITVALTRVLDAGNSPNNFKPLAVTINEESPKISALEIKYFKKKALTPMFKSQNRFIDFFKFKIFQKP
ncbi:Stp1/IreP family PP2C-type Ser/Thr phosphatase [candidate division KSB1 bacterium]|nr:Stp1/IreP family PP2C-type Ser/Thr phosphatase [candidate division KSB1 bacterium]